MFARCRGEIDVVEANGMVRHDPERRAGGIEQLAVDALGRVDEQPVSAGDRGEELLARRRPVPS